MRHGYMVSYNREDTCETLFELRESLFELIRYTYLSGLQDGKELWNEHEEVLDIISNQRVSKIIGGLNLS